MLPISVSIPVPTTTPNTPPPGHRRPPEGHAAPITGAGLLLHRLHLLGYRHRPGEGGLVHLQVVHLQYPKIRRDDPTLLKEDDVPGTNWAAGMEDCSPPRLTRESDCPISWSASMERTARHFGDEADGGVQYDDHSDGQRLHHLSEEERDPHGCHQQEHDEAAELLPENGPETPAGGLLQAGSPRRTPSGAPPPLGQALSPRPPPDAPPPGRRSGTTGYRRTGGSGSGIGSSAWGEKTGKGAPGTPRVRAQEPFPGGVPGNRGSGG